MTRDDACRFGLWWSHKRKTFTTPRQAAWSAWEAASLPDVKLLDTGAPRGGERNWHYVTMCGVEVFGSFHRHAAEAYRDALLARLKTPNPQMNGA